MHRLRRLLPFALLLSFLSLPGGAENPVPAHAHPVAADMSGDGPRELVLVPGLSGGTVSWEDTATRLSGTHRVHRIRIAGLELPATGHDTPGSIDDVADALSAYLQRNTTRPVALVGHSAGGVAALLVAMRRPELVERVVIVDALPFMSANRGSAGVDAELRAAIAAEARDMRAEDASAFAQRMRGQASSAVGDPDTAIRIAQAGARSDRETYASLYESLSTTDLRTDIADLRPPLTVIFADQSPLGAPAGHMAARYRAQYAGSRARLVEIKQARHYLMLDQPAEFARALDAALGD
jgi:pimeloyl-ACP methyl ester carboxylesterase